MKLDLRKQESRLLTKKAELEREIAALTEAYPTPVSSAEASVGRGDREDVTTDFLEMQQEQSLQVNEQALLTLVNNALQRLADHAYGRCLQCGKAIPAKRLEALPWAERCLQCEEQLEQHYASREEVSGEPQTF